MSIYNVLFIAWIVSLFIGTRTVCLMLGIIVLILTAIIFADHMGYFDSKLSSKLFENNK